MNGEHPVNYWQRKAEERAAARAPVARAPAEAPTGIPSPAEETRGAGLLTKYRPVGGWRSPGEAQAAPSLAEAGEPTSFAGGAGAPPSIGIIRGMKQTYAPAAQPGDQFIEGEYGTRLQAGQAYNRMAKARDLAETEGLPVSPETKDFFRQEAEKRYGEYRAPGQTLEEAKAAAAAKSPYFEAEAERIRRGTVKDIAEENVATFKRRRESLYGPVDKTKATPAEQMDITAAEEIARTQGDEKGVKHYQESLLMRQHEPLVTGANLQYLQEKVPGQKVPTSQELAIIKQSPEAWRKTVLHYGPYLKQLGPKPIGDLWKGTSLTPELGY